MPATDRDLQERAVRREMAGRYSAGILTYNEVEAWMRTYFPQQVRSGRLHGELVVTLEAMDNVPGDDVQRFTNKLGESVYRKKLSVPGSPTVEITLTAYEESEGAVRK